MLCVIYLNLLWGVGVQVLWRTRSVPMVTAELNYYAILALTWSIRTLALRPIWLISSCFRLSRSYSWTVFISLRAEVMLPLFNTMVRSQGCRSRVLAVVNQLLFDRIVSCHQKVAPPILVGDSGGFWCWIKTDISRYVGPYPVGGDRVIGVPGYQFPLTTSGVSGKYVRISVWGNEDSIRVLGNDVIIFVSAKNYVVYRSSMYDSRPLDIWRTPFHDIFGEL